MLNLVSDKASLDRSRCSSIYKDDFNCVGEDVITTAESLQFDFGTIESATNRFSDDNKLGQGGFGEVYKVCQLKITSL